MNTYNFNDENFKNTDIYKKFLEENPSYGHLKIRAYAAREAIPISGLRVVIKKIIDNNIIVFFDGYTNDSGLIEKIDLPTPKLNVNNLDVPNSITYDIDATYLNNIKLSYKANMYEDICVVQNISLAPLSNIGDL